MRTTTSDERLKSGSSSEYAKRPTTRSDGGIVEIAALVPLLALKAGMAFLRLKARRNRGVRVFRKQLKHSGLSKDQIEDLASDYGKMGRLRSYLPGDLPGLRFMRS